MSFSLRAARSFLPASSKIYFSHPPTARIHTQKAGLPLRKAGLRDSLRSKPIHPLHLALCHRALRRGAESTSGLTISGKNKGKSNQAPCTRGLLGTFGKLEESVSFFEQEDESRLRKVALPL
jgi:hypothetical protein